MLLSGYNDTHLLNRVTMIETSVKLLNTWKQYLNTHFIEIKLSYKQLFE